MAQEKIIIFAELTALPDYVDQLRKLAVESRIETVKEEGCETFILTFNNDNPLNFRFFEVFKSQDALDWHLEQSYAKAFMSALDGKLEGSPSLIRVTEFDYDGLQKSYGRKLSL